MASENGWNPAWVGVESLEWVTVPGTNVTLQILKGWPLAILRAFAADYNAYVETLRDNDSACYTPTNSVSTSNHLNGTAMDLNWDGPDGKTFRLGITEERAYPGDKARNLRDLLAFYNHEGLQIVFCGGAWSIRDWMHFQLDGNTWNNPKTGDFIARKIRADGFSTYKRGTTPMPSSSAAETLAAATGVTFAKAQLILPTVQQGLALSNCTNTNRIAMWLAQMGHESASFVYTEEIEDHGDSTDRWKYKGRTWIQITWMSNYADFSRWCFDRGLVPTPTYFVDRPTELADLKWAGIGPAWYWTVQRSDINQLSDKRDLVTVTQRINGGQNGIDDRRNRYNRALALGDQLLTLLTGEDDLSAEAERMIREVHGALFNKVPSGSIYATPGEGAKWQLHELIKNDDGMIHQIDVEYQAKAGNLDELARVVRTAKGQGTQKDAWAVQRAQRVLTEIETANPEVLQRYITQRGSL